MGKNKLYILLTLGCIVAYSWVFYNLEAHHKGHNHTINACFIKNITGVPCPSCGSTRSVISLLKHEFLEAIYWNPLGLIILTVMIISPIWIVYDLLLKRDSLHIFYKKVEVFLKKRSVAIPIILLLLINWVWNISKGL